MKDTVWLHIGTHKTGTTAIQNTLKDYDDGTTRYARLMRPNHSLALSVLFRDPKGSMNSLRNQGITGAEAESWVAAARARLMEELDSPARQLVISAEGLCNFWAEDLTRLRDIIAPHTRSFRVLAYVRDPLGFASSMFQQLIKNGKGAFVLPDLAYRPRLEPALQVFGKDAVEVVRFDKSNLPGGDVIADFCARIGIDRSRLRLEPANERLSAAATGLIYGFNQRPESKLGTKARFRARYALIERLAEALPGKLRLDPDLVRSRVERADLDWLAETWGVDFRPGLSAAGPEPGDIGNEADLLAAREAARPALERLAARQLIASKGRSTDDLLARLYKVETVRQTLFGLVRGRK
jgi:hypothetical protein